MKNLDNIILVFEELNEKKPKIEVDKRYSENPESTDILKKIEVSKEKVRKYLIEYIKKGISYGNFEQINRFGLTMFYCQYFEDVYYIEIQINNGETYYQLPNDNEVNKTHYKNF